MAASIRRRSLDAFQIHEDELDALSAADTEMQEQGIEDEAEENDQVADTGEEDSGDENHMLPNDFSEDMASIERHFTGFKQRFRLMNRIGEGGHDPNAVIVRTAS
jgi:cell division control protein 7